MSKMRYSTRDRVLVDRHIVRHGIVPQLAHINVDELLKDMGCVGPLHEKYTSRKIEDYVRRCAAEFGQPPYAPRFLPDAAPAGGIGTNEQDQVIWR